MEETAKQGRNGRWGMILAGGDGTRLRPLTRRITGDERPKQFCPILGGETLLDRTRRRVALTIPTDRTFLVVTRSHEPYYSPLLVGVPPQRVVAQPDNRGTTPAILYGLLRIAAWAPESSVAIFPSDHYVSDDEAFMLHVEAGFEAVRRVPESVALLGIDPTSPEVEYGWIEPGVPIFLGATGALFRVRRFWEKPAPALARTLLSKGCLWNSFVVMGRVLTLLSVIERSVSDLYRAFRGIHFGSRKESEDVHSLYRRLPSSNFSQKVLACSAGKLAVLPVSGVEWSDWGDPARVISSLARIGVRPDWAAALQSATMA
jgi:mannose-1-phosphate guanylyltransferase